MEGINKIIDRIVSLPLTLKVLCLASGIIGALQILGLILPVFSPRANGMVLESPILGLAMGVIHLSLAWAVLRRMPLAIPVIIFIPLAQYGIIYMDTGVPSEDVLNKNLFFSGVWMVSFSVYFFVFKASRFFNVSKDA